jgi:hypothetical protein
MKTADELGEFPTWEYIISFLKSRGCTYDEHVDSEGRTERIFKNPYTGQEYSNASFHTDEELRWEILESICNVLGISLDR